MLTKPTAAELIESVKVSLMKEILPELQTDHARVLLFMMQTLLTPVQRRVPLEQQYMADECNRMTALLRDAAQSVAGASGQPAARLRDVAASLGERSEYAPLPAFAALNSDYRERSEALTDAIEQLNALDGAGNEAAHASLERVRAYLSLRAARDMEAHFAMDAGLVGRG